MRVIISGSTVSNVCLPTNVYATQISLVSANIPYSWFNINETNNYYSINGINFNIPIQQYNIFQLLNAINSNGGITLGFNKASLKVNLTPINPDGNIIPRIVGTNIIMIINFNNLATLIGFENNTDYVFDNLLPSISPKLVDVCNTRCIYIRSNLASTDLVVLQNNQVITNNILFRIPISGKFGDIISYNNSLDINLNSSLDEVIKNIQIELIDSNLQPINFNGMMYQLEFVIKLAEKEIVNRTELRKEEIINRTEDNSASIPISSIINEIHRDVSNLYTDKQIHQVEKEFHHLVENNFI